MERRDGMDLPTARSTEVERLRYEVLNWLESKGGPTSERQGVYQPEDGSVGRFRIEDAHDGNRSWWMLRLEEQTTEGRLFATALSITGGSALVSMYITLETGWATTQIMPVKLDPRCPRIVRHLLKLPGRWYHGQSSVRVQHRVNGFEAGTVLAEEIRHDDRTIPFVVVSTVDGAPAAPNLDSKLAHDLAGVANVVVVDEEASWALTDLLGGEFCCYWGAVRLYWPHFSSNSNRFFHPLWTADWFRSGSDTTDRLRAHLRGVLFRAAALSVARPREIEEIRDAAQRRTVTELRERASSLEDYATLANEYARDCDELRRDRDLLRERLEVLQAQVVRLEGERQALVAHLRAASVPDAGTPAHDTPIQDPSGANSVIAPPVAGEIRYYKKTYSRPGHDVMVLVGDCGCNNWESAHAADKARKGVTKFEGGRTDWQSIQHCASCTGGGTWKVRW